MVVFEAQKSLTLIRVQFICGLLLLLLLLAFGIISKNSLPHSSITFEDKIPLLAMWGTDRGGQSCRMPSQLQIRMLCEELADSSENLRCLSVAGLCTL